MSPPQGAWGDVQHGGKRHSWETGTGPVPWWGLRAAQPKERTTRRLVYCSRVTRSSCCGPVDWTRIWDDRHGRKLVVHKYSMTQYRKALSG